MIEQLRNAVPDCCMCVPGVPFDTVSVQACVNPSPSAAHSLIHSVFVVLRVFSCTSRSLRVWFHCEPTCPYHVVFACCCLFWLAPDVSWYRQPQYVVRCTFTQPVKHTSFFTTLLTSATCPPNRSARPCFIDYACQRHVSVFLRASCTCSSNNTTTFCWFCPNSCLQFAVLVPFSLVSSKLFLWQIDRHLLDIVWTSLLEIQSSVVWRDTHLQ